MAILARTTAHRGIAGLGLLTLMLPAGCFAPSSATLSPPDYPSAAVQITPPEEISAPGVHPQPATPMPESRAAGVTPPAQTTPTRQWKYIVLHHSATEGATVEAIDAVHRQRTDSQGRPWLGIAYHYVVGNGEGMPDGTVEPTFRWKQQLHGAHAGAREYNDHGIGICLVGNFEQHPPTARQLAATRELIAMLQDRYDIPTDRIIPHGDVVATACPGRHFSLADIIPAK